MNGLTELSESEKQEMIEDAKDIERRRAFNAARILSEQGSIDNYIDFLSEHIHLIDVIPSRKITTNYKL